MNKADSCSDLLLFPFHMMDRSLHRKNRRRKAPERECAIAKHRHTMDSIYCQLSSSPSAFILFIWILFSSALVGLTHGADLATNIPKFHFVREPAVSTLTQSGSPARLDCVVAYSGRTEPDIHWIREAGEGQPGIRLDDSTVRYRLSNGSLYFKRVSDPGNTGSYRCGATVPGVGTIVSREAHLDVTYLRKPLQREPTDLALAPGDTAAFECLVEARPHPKVTWYKGDIRVVEGQGRGVHIYPTGLLEIGPLKPTDYNSYSCVVEVPGHSVRSRAAVLSQLPASDPKLRGTPKFVVRPRSQYTVRGESVYLHCVGQGRDGKGKPPALSWLKDGRMLSPEEHEGRLEMVGAGTLVIKSVTQADQGVYTCRAVNQDDTADADATLTVFVPPEITTGPSNVAAQEKTDLTLTCSAQGVPEPQVRWYKEGIPISPGGNYHQILANGDLLILGVKRMDSGMYQCMASNELEDTQASARLLVYTGAEARQSDTARRKPPPPQKLKPVLVSTRFVTVSWEVPESTGPDTDRLTFSVFWRDVNSERERLDNTTERQFSMQHLQPNTEYEVRVRSYNSEGQSATEAKLTVKTQSEVLVPSEPLKLAATPISPTEITVTWEPPQEPNGAITEYELSYYRERGKRELKRRTRKLSLRLRQLDEYTKYSIRVAAVNSKGVGSSTPEIEAMTFSDRPSEPPRNFTLEVSSSTSLIVRWQPPPQSSQNGIITGYKIRRRRKGDKQKGETVTTSGDRNNYALIDLEKGTEYQVRVAAMTANGTGPHTPWLAAATFSEEFRETGPPDQPAGLSIIVKAHSIDVSWLPPPNNILVRRYILGYGKNIPNVYKKILEPHVRRYVIENLSPGTLYVVNLQAENSEGPSPQKLAEVVTLVKDEEPLTPMSPPLGITANVLSPSLVQLTWSDSSLADDQKIADNRFYTVNYRRPGRRKKWGSVKVRRQNALIKDLRPFTKYEFCVKVTKGDRESDFSMTVIATTDEKAPSTEPKDITPAALPDNPLAISLSWQPPSRPNGRITDYLIYYTTDLHAKDIVWPVEGVEGNSLTTLIDNLTPDTTYYFKVQARNSKGKGPKSKAVKYVTPPAPQTEPTGEKEEEGLGISLPIIAGACIAIIVLISVFSIGIYYLCKRRSEPSGLTKSPKGPPPQGVKPPDLWTHQPSNLELNKLGRSNRSESSASVATSTIRRGSRGSGDHTDDQGSTLDRRRNSYVGEGGYPSSGEERYQPIQPRNLIRPKPVMMPIDGPGAFRDPMGVPGSGPSTPMLQYGDAPGGPLPMRPIYPRTQYTAQYGAPYSNPARVNAGDLPHSCPNNGKALTVVAETDKDGDLPSSMEDSFNSRIGYVKPQQNISPYRKPNAPVTSTPHKGQRTPVSFNSKSPETKLKKEEADLSKSLSTEELTAEMANLEGLMKDLNAITQQEFEC